MLNLDPRMENRSLKIANSEIQDIRLVHIVARCLCYIIHVRSDRANPSTFFYRWKTNFFFENFEKEGNTLKEDQKCLIKYPYKVIGYTCNIFTLITLRESPRKFICRIFMSFLMKNRIFYYKKIFFNILIGFRLKYVN